MQITENRTVLLKRKKERKSERKSERKKEIKKEGKNKKLVGWHLELTPRRAFCKDKLMSLWWRNKQKANARLQKIK